MTWAAEIEAILEVSEMRYLLAFVTTGEWFAAPWSKNLQRGIREEVSGWGARWGEEGRGGMSILRTLAN